MRAWSLSIAAMELLAIPFWLDKDGGSCSPRHRHYAGIIIDREKFAGISTQHNSSKIQTFKGVLWQFGSGMIKST